MVPAPGARVIGPSTKWLVPSAAMTFVTVTLVRVMLPVFVRVPVMTLVWPGCNSPGGQLFVTAMLGEFVPGQTAVKLLVTRLPKHLSEPAAITVSEYGPQESN